MELERIKYNFSVCKIKNISDADFNNEFCFLSKTDEEISLVCITDYAPENTIEREDGWKAFRIKGTLDFSLIGILSKISSLLAKNNISIFALSTYNTDYILVKSENYQRAQKILTDEGYKFI